MKGTKETALKAARKVLEGKTISLNEYESLVIIKETEKDLADEETINKLTALRCWARTKRPCWQALRILAEISRKIRK